MRGLALALCVMVAAGPALAVQPGEILVDPLLEARARDISRGLRCLVCRNEAIDESNAELARDLRLLVRDRITAGDTDAEVTEFVVARYGEYVLLQPKTTGSNVLLWLAGPAMMLAAGGISLAYVRRRTRAQEPDGMLSDEETTRLRRILGE